MQRAYRSLRYNDKSIVAVTERQLGIHAGAHAKNFRLRRVNSVNRVLAFPRFA